MNRFKKEIRKRGFKLTSDYEYMPYEIKGGFYLVLEAVIVDSENAIVYRHYNVLSEKHVFARDMGARVYCFKERIQKYENKRGCH